MEQRWRKVGIGNLGSIWPDLDSMDYKVPEGPYFTGNFNNPVDNDGRKKLNIERKVCVLGNKNVGKTHIIKSLGKVSWIESSYSSNGVYSRFLTKYTINIPLLSVSEKFQTKEASKFLELEFIEISSLKECDELRRKEINNCHLIIFVYSSNDQTSFDDLTNRWLKFIHKLTTPALIIDNYRQDDIRCFSLEVGQERAFLNGVKFASFTNDNQIIEDLMKTITNLILSLNVYKKKNEGAEKLDQYINLKIKWVKRNSACFNRLPGVGHPTIHIEQNTDKKKKKEKLTTVHKYSTASTITRKICVLGNKNTGKTHLITSLVSFFQDGLDEFYTNSTDFVFSQTVTVPLNKQSAKERKKLPVLCEIVLTEIASNKSLDAIRQEELLKSHAVIIVYSPNDRFSFWDVSERWVPLIESTVNNSIPIIIICNIRQEEYSFVSTEEGKHMAIMNKCGFLVFENESQSAENILYNIAVTSVSSHRDKKKSAVCSVM
ncbi:DgyrCDS13158 [Dimorphilus gyrociliatus]|uniref:DgyrCDS13158 n=1 Tax=Dimorphilus gyrociliatus TaxID=2664684 RepID=A0A7I8W9X5_9ANNE|nr:DgyrCDS13158 [Dimorphilus gyrociliatus]